MKVPIELGQGSYESKALPFSAQRCINMYSMPAQAPAVSQFGLFPTPGIVSFGTAGNFPSRGATVMNGVYYVITSTTLYSVDSDGVATSQGTVAGSARCSMADNGDKLCIVVPGGAAYVYTASTDTFAQITDPDYVTSDTVSFKDGYYIFTQTDGLNWFVSNLNDPSAIDALDFGSAELDPDKIICSHVTYDEVVIFGERTAEVFQNIGGSGFPFQRIPGASYEKGCLSKHTPIQWDNDYYFIGAGTNEKAAIFRVAGGRPVRISTDAIEQQIQNFTDTEISNAFSFSYSAEGVQVVGFTFESVNIDSKTVCYNVSASNKAGRPIWFEQQAGITDAAWRVATIDSVYGKFLVSDTIDGRLGYLDDDTMTDYGSTILRLKSTVPFANLGTQIFLNELELYVDAGHGLNTGQGIDPQVMMDFSYDGGHTYSSELKRSVGKIGEYFIRPVWRSLGRVPYQAIFRFKISDPIKTAFLQASADIVQ